MVKIERADKRVYEEETRKMVSNETFSFVLYTCQTWVKQQKGDHRRALGRELGVPIRKE
jgi:hypothetical protein